MAQLAAHMPVAQLVSPQKRLGAATGREWECWHGPELHQGYADDSCEPGLTSVLFCLMLSLPPSWILHGPLGVKP